MALICQTDSRLADSSRSWLQACDVDHTGFIRNEFILATFALDNTPHSGSAADFKLQWRRVGGTFADVAVDTEICWGTGTVLIDGTEPCGTLSGCRSPDISHENEGDNLAEPSAVDAGLYLEIQWALGFGSGALGDQEYEFQLYNVTDDNTAVCSVSITTYDYPSILDDGNTPAWYIYDKMETITKDGGNLVSDWEDCFESGNDLEQATETNKPLWSAGGITFDGIDNYMSALFTWNDPLDIWFVIKMDTWAQNKHIFANNAAGGIEIAERGAISPVIRFEGELGQTADCSDLAVDTWGIIRIIVTAGDDTMIINNGNAFTASVSDSSMGGMFLGSSSTPASYSNISVKEIICRDINDTSTNRTIILNYLNSKYSIFAGVNQQSVGQGATAIAGAAKKKTLSDIFGQYSMTIIGAAKKKTLSSNFGQHAMTIIGTLANLPKKLTGQYALSIAGTLAKKLSAFKATGSHAMSITGTLIRKTYKLGLGAYAIVITGTLISVKKFFANVGGYALTIAGSVSTKLSAFRAVGQHSMTIAGTLIRKTVKLGLGAYAIVITGSLAATKKFFESVGGYALTIAGALSSLSKKIVGTYSMTITGVLIKKTTKKAGEYAMSIAGTLISVKKFFQTVGNYAIVITGTLIKKLSAFRAVGQYAITITGSLIRKTIKLGLGAYSMTITGSLNAIKKFAISVGGYTISIIGALISTFITSQVIEEYITDSFITFGLAKDSLITFEMTEDSRITFELEKNSII